MIAHHLNAPEINPREIELEEKAARLLERNEVLEERMKAASKIAEAINEYLPSGSIPPSVIHGFALIVQGLMEVEE